MIPYDSHAIVELGGATIDSWQGGSLIEGVEVELATGEASAAEVRVFDPDPDYAFIKRLAAGDGVAELPARVWLGFGAQQELGEPVFKGQLAAVEREGQATVCRFYDAGFKMRRLQRAEYHRNLTDLEIIAKLARRSGLLFEGPEQSVSLDKHKSLKQEGQTDWALALDCAERSGFVLYVRGDTLFAKEAAKTGAPLITLKHRADFLLLDDFRLSYRAPENVEGRPAKVETRGRGRGGKRLKGASHPHARGTEQVEIKRDLRAKSKRGADKRAEARKALQREHAFHGTIGVLPSFKGRRPDVRDTVALESLPPLFNGNYLCDRVTHTFAPGDLRMELDVYRDLK